MVRPSAYGAGALGQRTSALAINGSKRHARSCGVSPEVARGDRRRFPTRTPARHTDGNVPAAPRRRSADERGQLNAQVPRGASTWPENQDARHRPRTVIHREGYDWMVGQEPAQSHAARELVGTTLKGRTERRTQGARRAMPYPLFRVEEGGSVTLPPGLRTQCGLDTSVGLVAVVFGPGKALCTTRTAILGELCGSQPPPSDATAARQSRAEPERGPLLAPQHVPGRPTT